MSAAIADMWKIEWKRGGNVTRSSAHLDNERRAASAYRNLELQRILIVITVIMAVLLHLTGGVCSSGDRYFTDSNTLSFQKSRDKIRISAMTLLLFS